MKSFWVKTMKNKWKQNFIVLKKRKKSYRFGGEVGKNVVDRAQENSNRTEAREYENAQTMVSGEAKLEEEIGESARQFAELSEEVSLHAREESV